MGRKFDNFVEMYQLICLEKDFNDFDGMQCHPMHTYLRMNPADFMGPISKCT